VSRAVLVCPGRGSYTESSLGSLSASDPLVQRAEELRATLGLEPLLALDSAERFQPARHLRPANVAALIYLVTLLDIERARAEHEILAIGGNSMGWYTALAAAGALSFEDGFRLVQTMALVQEGHEDGGQLIYPIVDETWRPDAEREGSVTRSLAQLEGEAFPSIYLGGYAVLAGTLSGLAGLLEQLPKVTQKSVTYPFRLAQHGPYHTPILGAVSDIARKELADLEFRMPHTALCDGRGDLHTPFSADPGELRDYTLGPQVTTPYDFTRSVRVLLREFAPDVVVLPGPGNTLGGPTGQVLVREGWRGIHSRGDFDVAQSSGRPAIASMGR